MKYGKVFLKGKNPPEKPFHSDIAMKQQHPNMTFAAFMALTLVLAATSVAAQPLTFYPGDSNCVTFRDRDATICFKKCQLAGGFTVKQPCSLEERAAGTPLPDAYDAHRDVSYDTTYGMSYAPTSPYGSYAATRYVSSGHRYAAAPTYGVRRRYGSGIRRFGSGGRRRFGGGRRRYGGGRRRYGGRYSSSASDDGWSSSSGSSYSGSGGSSGGSSSSSFDDSSSDSADFDDSSSDDAGDDDF